MSIRWNEAVILSGPSGVGKDTVLDAWIAANPRIQRVITCTTRQCRVGETHGVHYFFLSVEDFMEKAAHEGLLEHKQVHDNWYGSPVSEVLRIQEEGGIPVLKIDVQGALEVMERQPEVQSIFLLPPSFEALIERLSSRATESEAELERRIEAAREEIEAAPKYRHRVVNQNNQVERTVAELESILQGAHR